MLNRMRFGLGVAAATFAVTIAGPTGIPRVLAQGCPPNSHPVSEVGNVVHCRCDAGYSNKGGACTPNQAPAAQSPTTGDEVRQIAVAFAQRGGFRTPFSDPALCAFTVAEAKRTGVPIWLILIQARRETSFGDGTKNHTVMDGQLFTDGSRGNAHNLFNIRPGDTWGGRVLYVGPKSGKYRVYDSYEASITDYVNHMSSSLYRGHTLEQVAYTYFPPEDNGGREATEAYIKDLIGYAAEMGVAITRTTVLVP